MPEENPKGKIERLNDRLNSRTRYEAPEDLREPITPKESEEAPRSWDTPPIDELISERRQAEPYPLIKKVFFVAVVFFFCALSAAAIIYFKGDNFISTKNLDISVEGPVSVSAGSPVALHITITNNNNAAIDKVNMHIIYPEGTRSVDNSTLPVESADESIEALEPGGKITKDENVSFLGAEGEAKNIHISVNYRVTGSNAVFTKDKIFNITIGNAPVTMSITRPDSVVSGEPFSSTISIVSNSETTLRNVVLRAEFPYGWSFGSVSPPSSDTDHSIWNIGDLSPGDRKTIALTGTLTGEDNDERTFRFFVGVGKAGSNNLDTALSSDSFAVSINHPDLSLDVKLNGDSSASYAAQGGKMIQTTVTIKNNLPENLLAPQVEVKLSGVALDRSSVSSQSGNYSSGTGSVVWNQSNTDQLTSLAPGEERTFILNFASLSNLTSAANQKIDVSATLTGRPQGSNANQSVSVARTVRITSEAALSSKSLYSRGPFKNTGPVPPKADTETSYTVDLILGNTHNDILNAKVTGVLGANVKWTGDSSPGSEVVYDDVSRTVTWNVGTLASGAGFSAPGREAFFRVTLTPSIGQVGGVPVLFGNIAFAGMDSFASSSVRITNSAVTTQISSDPMYVQGDEIVVK